MRKRTYDLCYVIMTTKIGAWRKPAVVMFYTEKQIAETIAALERYSPGIWERMTALPRSRTPVKSRR